jgi:hypothetical protein
VRPLRQPHRETAWPGRFPTEEMGFSCEEGVWVFTSGEDEFQGKEKFISVKEKGSQPVLPVSAVDRQATAASADQNRYLWFVQKPDFFSLADSITGCLLCQIISPTIFNSSNMSNAEIIKSCYNI